MKKTKLLMLSTIAPLISVVPVITIVSCNENANGNSQFVCVQTTQDTEIGKSACWYTFNLTGKEQIPSDLNISLEKPYSTKLVELPLVHIINQKQLMVGIDGKTKTLADGESIGFGLVFESRSLKVNQKFNCKYIYHMPKIMATGNRVESLSPSKQVERLFSFTIVDESIQFSDLEVSVINADVSKGIPEPSVLEILKSGNNFDVKVCLPGEDDTIGKAGDYANFDLEFHDHDNTWFQTITNFGFQFEEVPYQQFTADTETQVVIDYKGNKQPAIKAMDGDHGVLLPSTPVGTPYEITFNLSDWKHEEYKQWKFGSYVHPEHSHVPYYHYSSIAVSAMISGKETPLSQTEPGDYDGVHGTWWVSEGGPITVLYEKIKSMGEVTSFIFKLRIAEKITNESSFYITYA